MVDKYVSKLEIDSGTYLIKDSEAREGLDSANKVIESNTKAIEKNASDITKLAK